MHAGGSLTPTWQVHLLQSLKHPNIIKCYGSFWSHPAAGSGVFHMVLEFAERGDLASLISRTKRNGEYLSEDRVWHLFLPVMRVAAYLHGQGIIHRDFKALNVFLTASNEVKVGDFGVGRVLSDDTLMVDTMYGTPLYLSPELCKNEPYNAKTDIWSCGVLLYELCALETPFAGRNLIELSKNICAGRMKALPARYSLLTQRAVTALLEQDQSIRPSANRFLDWYAAAKAKLRAAEAAVEEGARGHRGQDSDVHQEREKQDRDKDKHRDVGHQEMERRGAPRGHVRHGGNGVDGVEGRGEGAGRERARSAQTERVSGKVGPYASSGGGDERERRPGRGEGLEEEREDRRRIRGDSGSEATGGAEREGRGRTERGGGGRQVVGSHGTSEDWHQERWRKEGENGVAGSEERRLREREREMTRERDGMDRENGRGREGERDVARARAQEAQERERREVKEQVRGRQSEGVRGRREEVVGGRGNEVEQDHQEDRAHRWAEHRREAELPSSNGQPPEASMRKALAAEKRHAAAPVAGARGKGSDAFNRLSSDPGPPSPLVCARTCSGCVGVWVCARV